MSFLDNLENTLKALERQEERDPEKQRREQQRRESDRAEALRAAPHAEALRESAFTSELLGQCRAVGREKRVLAQFVWLGDTLRIDAGGRRMELAPTPDGIEAVRSEDGVEQQRRAVDTAKDDAAALARWWLQ